SGLDRALDRINNFLTRKNEVVGQRIEAGKEKAEQFVRRLGTTALGSNLSATTEYAANKEKTHRETVTNDQERAEQAKSVYLNGDLKKATTPEAKAKVEATVDALNELIEAADDNKKYEAAVAKHSEILGADELDKAIDRFTRQKETRAQTQRDGSTPTNRKERKKTEATMQRMESEAVTAALDLGNAALVSSEAFKAEMKKHTRILGKTVVKLAVEKYLDQSSPSNRNVKFQGNVDKRFANEAAETARKDANLQKKTKEKAEKHLRHLRKTGAKPERIEKAEERVTNSERYALTSRVRARRDYRMIRDRSGDGNTDATQDKGTRTRAKRAIVATGSVENRSKTARVAERIGNIKTATTDKLKAPFTRGEQKRAAPMEQRIQAAEKRRKNAPVRAMMRKATKETYERNEGKGKTAGSAGRRAAREAAQRSDAARREAAAADARNFFAR
ncbi:MAG: hypothetical protein JWL85_745, partial [Candidatus Saccharibacteria bacterium]|nr:hypothetical protein [Candidatus Saccharibacteria bacterium]